MSVPFRPLGDRVVIKADREDHAPTETDSGLLLAKSLAAAVDGYDAEDSWFVGTVVAVGPLVNRFDVRPWLRRRFQQFHAQDKWWAVREQLEAELEELPLDCPDPLHVGDRAVFSWQAGQELTVDGEKFLLMRQRDVLAVLDDPDEVEAVPV